MSSPLELLAPAGNRACLDAALEAGADAVYLGLTTLNARRYARNFSEGELADACVAAHARGRRVHLALNIDLAQDELSRAARSLEVASRLGVDVVIVRDPALLALRRHFPELEYHLSTQACVTSSADVEAARDLGVRRVVLARELTLAEIVAASRVEGVETEVFAHGAMCFSVSGRCLLSSWVGGRSGNRGQCTSPCRVDWTLDGEPGGTPFSMHDLSLVARMDELRHAGVRAVKIEGRMKNPSWVRASVALLRRAIDGADAPDELARDAERRGAPPGRRLTSGYLDGQRHDLVERGTPGAAGPSKEAAETPHFPQVTVRDDVAELLRAVDAPAQSGSGPRPDRVRLTAEQAPAFLARVTPAAGAIVEGLDGNALAQLKARVPGVPLVVALPGVSFEEELPQLAALVAAAVLHGVTVEANSWGGWFLSRRAGARMMAGPGLAVLNALAARELAARGFQEVTASVEADALKLEALVGRITTPCSVVAFGRPALMTTRVELPEEVAAAEVEDRRAARMRARRVGAVWEWRPVQPFDVRGLRLPPGTAHVVVDLIASPDPLAEWERGPDGASHFNMDRVLS
ncbi:MAG: U32 family peptidase [Deltaproteobacteria bacterium]|nr:U32 family peptidase [Deltaproteobacteria bacterium]